MRDRRAYERPEKTNPGHEWRGRDYETTTTDSKRFRMATTVREGDRQVAR